MAEGTEAPDPRIEKLRIYCGAPATDVSFVTECVEQATALVTRFVGQASVPTAIVDRAVLEVGSELFHRKQAPNGIAQFATADGQSPIRVARDPMIAAYPILQPFTGVGIA